MIWYMKDDDIIDRSFIFILHQSHIISRTITQIVRVGASMQVGRMKNVAVASHVKAQKHALLDIVESAGPGVSHCIITRLADDTNIWIHGARNAQQDKMKGKSGSKKVTSVLGLCERLSLCSNGRVKAFIQLITPAQVLSQEGMGSCSKLFLIVFLLFFFS